MSIRYKFSIPNLQKHQGMLIIMWTGEFMKDTYTLPVNFRVANTLVIYLSELKIVNSMIFWKYSL